ncbi:MAG TPA: OmpH family outer membrane protein [Bacteroidales bacterium]|nr:OmpH family outer membrane protein [Bacteroidales bacterium]
MKKLFSIVLLTVVCSLSGIAQKFAFVDTDYILNNIPSYKAAQEQIDKLSADWQKEVEAKYAEIDKMYKTFQTEKVLLSDEMKNKREDEIVKKEQEAKELQKKYFGKEGALYKKQQELVKPIQDEIYNAVKEISVEQGYAVIFDSAAGAGMLYTNPKNDKSDEVLQKLGYKN